MTVTMKLWVIFFLAQFLHMTVRAGLATRSQYTPWNSLQQYVRKFWPQLMTRVFLACLIFSWWIHVPAQLGVAILLPANPATAGIFGWFSDSVLDQAIGILLPNVKASLPALPAEDVKADAAEAGK